MASTYTNDLRIELQTTGENAGTWGTKTNAALTQIAEAFSYGTKDCFAADANQTVTVPDGTADASRALYLKVTSSATLTATRTLTLGPNTISRLMFIENATTGSQSITISQGSGANVTIATAKTAVVYLDGAGSGAAVVDAMAKVDPGVTDTLLEVLVAGNTTGGTDLAVSTGDDITFADSSKAIFGAGSDLQIYHDGSNSIIDNTGAGSLIIQDTDGTGDILIRPKSGQTAIAAYNDNAVEIGYAGATKLGTTSTGIDVTGSAVISEDLLLGSNGRVRVGSTGSLASPTIYLDTDPNTGIYFPSTDSIGFVAGGAEKLTVNSTGISVDGTATMDGLTVGATDRIYLDGGSNTYIQESGADDLRFFVGGAQLLRLRASGGAYVNAGSTNTALTIESTDTEVKLAFVDPTGRAEIRSRDDFRFYVDDGARRAMDITTTGNVGIGDSNPDRLLTLKGDNSYMWIKDAGGGNTGFIGSSGENDGLMRLYNGAHAAKVEIHSDAVSYFNGGNVGIGTSSPAYKTVISANGASGIEFGPAYSGTANLTQHYNRSGGAYVKSVNEAAEHQFNIGGSAKVNIDASGNVGIGTNSITGLMELNKTSSGNTLQLLSLVNPVGAASTGAQLWMSGTNATTRGATIEAVAQSTANNHDLIFSTSAGSATPSEALRIDSSQQVGIGTSSPAALLHVKGDTDGDGITIQRNSTTANTYGQLGFSQTTNDAGTPNLFIRGYRGSSFTDNFMTFGTGGSGAGIERMRIDASGNVGIGTSGPAAKLHVRDTSNVISKLEAVGDFFPYLQIERSGGSSKTNQKYTHQIGSSGHYYLQNATSANPFYHMQCDPDGDVHIAGNASASSFLADFVRSTNTIALNAATTNIGDSGSNGVLDIKATSSGVFKLNGVEIMRMKGSSSSNAVLGIGTSGPSSTYSIDTVKPIRIIGNAPYIDVTESDSSNQRWIYGAVGGNWVVRDMTGITYPFQIVPGSPTNSVKINPTNVSVTSTLLVGTTSTTDSAKLSVFSTGTAASFRTSPTTGVNLVTFRNGNGLVGKVTTSGSTTTYNTTSDQRLKENITDAADAGATIDAIQVRQFDWKSDGSHQDYGMVAQELIEVAPEAVAQPSDESEMMGVDYSKLVPMLLKEVQQLRQRVAQLES